MSDELKIKASEIVAAYVTRNQVTVEEVPRLLQSLIETLLGRAEVQEPVPPPVPPVSIADSVKFYHLICLEDGKPVKMRKRYLMTHFGMTPEDYIRKWGLPEDYPMVCEEYSQSRRNIAMKQGLGKSQSKSSDDLVFDPFGGIGTVPVRAIKLGRRGKSVELNAGYWQDAVKYVEAAARDVGTPSLFDLLDSDAA